MFTVWREDAMESCQVKRNDAEQYESPLIQ